MKENKNHSIQYSIKKRSNYSFKECIQSKQSQIIQSKKIFIQLKNWFSPRTSMRKPSHGKRNSVPDDIPIRLVVTFAVQSLHPSPGVWLQISQARRPNASDSLFVMAKHGQLLKHSFDSVLDQSGFQNNFCLKCNICHPPAIAKDKVCPRSLSEPSCRRYLKANVMYYSIPKK